MDKLGKSRFACIFVLICLSATMLSCSRSGRKMNIPEVGLSMRIPSGWKIGNRIGWEGTSYFVEQPSGKYCFEAVNQRFPHGSVVVSPIEPQSKITIAGLADHITTGSVITRTNRIIDGHDAIEIVEQTSDLGGPISIIHLLLRESNKSIYISFCVRTDDFPQYESKFRRCIDSIKFSGK
jgi:hypothetical protein